ncbi:TRAP transporter substrate-binding protein [Agrococcus sp. SL85]|uniref:TRAP transporter substrate-binding protein n=1 Tax=Agrococcus sp. SL85 TaxID=2995141 RepID=UPI00226C9269|nr:TRAP transporter substrate-binding protein [Agrococcus sp. SL85]WAC66881.1 TRAP transporter substrate-binding protein [Agrococcus sp. SL85]
MRTTKLIAGAGIVALALAGCSSGGADPAASGGGEDDGQPITLVLGHAGSTTDPRQWAAEQFAERIEEATDGQVTVEIHSDSTLGTWEEMIDGLQIDSVDIVIESMLSVEAYTDLASVETAPFLYEDDEQFFEVWEGELGAEIKTAVTEASGYALLGNMYRGARQLTTKEPVTQLSDLQGLTIRTPSAQTMLDTWNALGARAEALPFNEVYSALESGVLDGQENPLDAILFNSIHEVAPNIGETSHMFANYHFIMWDDALQGLPEDVRTAITEVADEVGQEYTQNTVTNTEDYRAQLEEGGAVFTEITDRDAWIEATTPVVEGLPDQVQTWVEQIRAM